MTRVLVLGATGMVGHKVAQVMSEHTEHFEVWGTVRDSRTLRAEWATKIKLLWDVDAHYLSSVRRAIHHAQPHWIINCIGSIPQKNASAADMITTNAVFPHRLADMVPKFTQIIHISTDAVFSGERGNYTETDTPDPRSPYGNAKLLGDLPAPHLTLRCAPVGRELVGYASLVEWFFKQDKAMGYCNHLFSPITTIELGKTLVELMYRPRISGVYHLGGPSLTKLEFLRLLRDAYGLNTEIVPYYDMHTNRTLNSSRFWRETEMTMPTIEGMLLEMSLDPTPGYEGIYREDTRR